jgi:serine/threonine protein kinase
VFAAGVVLYILLCGRPPFNSTSNREVLEKTCKGAYKISGAFSFPVLLMDCTVLVVCCVSYR